MLDYIDAKERKDGKYYRGGTFTALTGLHRARLSEYSAKVQPKIETVLTICVGLGLNLLLTELFMYSLGLCFSFSDNEIKKWIAKNQGEGAERIFALNQYLKQNNIDFQLIDKFI